MKPLAFGAATTALALSSTPALAWGDLGYESPIAGFG